MARLILPGSVEYSLATQKATSAAPGLSPEKRAVADVTEFQRFKQEVNIQEGFDKQRALNIVDNGRSVANEQARMGKMLSNADLEKRLKVLNANIHVEEAMSNASVLGIYILGNFGELPNGEKLNKRFVCRMDRGWMTEGDVHKFKLVKRLIQTNPPEWEYIPELDVNDMRRGWRSILATLLKGGYITEAGIMRVFGPPSWDSANWQQATT
jgi:hypothetical protein